MVRGYKRKKLTNKHHKVSKMTLMNLNQLLPCNKKYTTTQHTKHAIIMKQNSIMEIAKRNERVQLVNLCCKYSEEQQKSFRLATEASDITDSTLNTNGDNSKPTYYLHKAFIGYMDNRNKETEYTLFKDHFENTRKVIGILNQLKDQKQTPLVNNSEPKIKFDKKLLVLDLDETLISSNECPPHNWDNTEIINFQLTNKFNYTIYVKFRPFVFEFLEAVSKYYDIAIFTASEKAYADSIINKLDPERKLISKRYYNTDCDQLNGIFVKDLSKLGRSLKDVIIVDNTVLCFAYQLNNGVPILSYYGDGQPCDSELIDLKDFLLYLKDFSDVRQPITDYFKWDQLCEIYKEKEKVMESIFYD